MTDERQNEIWAMLPEDFKKEVKELWEFDTLPVHPDYDRDSVTEGAAYILIELFGEHNLTAQAKEKPEEPKFKVGDLVKIPRLNIEDPLRITRIEDGLAMTFWDKAGVKVGTDIEHIVPYTELKENPKAKDFPILSDSLQASVDWNSYRLDLAKELAVAMVGNYNDTIPDVAVGIANEIVKLLKETEE